MDPDALPLQKPASNYTRPSDPSKYIRTYAKDVAALTNTPLPVTPAAPKPNAPAPSAPSVQPNATGTIHEEGVTLTDFDASPVNRPADQASSKEFPQEVVELSQTDSDGIFAGKPAAPAQEPVPMPKLAEPPAPLAPPPPAPKPAALPSNPDADREAVLARLRAKLAESRPAPIAASAPEPEAPIRTAAPDFAQPAEFVPPKPEPLPPVPSQPKPIERPAPSGPAPLHTYSSDFAQHIDTQKGSTFSVLAAESDSKRPAPQAAPRKRRTLVPLLAGIAMLLIGIGAVAGAYAFLRHEPLAPAVATVPSLIVYDEAVEIKGSGTALQQALSDAAQGTGIQSNVVVTYVTSATASSSTGIPQPGAVLIRSLGLGAPDILLRNIEDQSTVGFMRVGDESRPFFILKASSYERTFAGMLAWERTMPDDLATLYPAYPSIPTSASTTASTTAAIETPFQPMTFVDAVVANYDVRVLRNASGHSLLLYGYVSKDLLVIARDEVAFTALAERLVRAGK